MRQAAQEEEHLRCQLNAFRQHKRDSTPPKATRTRLAEDDEHPSGGRAPRAPGLPSERKRGKARASLERELENEITMERDEDEELRLALEVSLADM